MPAQKPPSLSDLSDNDPKYVLISDTVLLPNSRKEIIDSFQQILSLGGVQKVMIEIGRPIQFTRLVREDLIAPEARLTEEDPLDAVRAGEVEEFHLSGELLTDREISPLEILFHAFTQLDEQHYEPKMVVVGSWAAFRAWLTMPLTANLNKMFGVKVVRSATAPDDAVFISGAMPAEPDRIAYTLKIDLELPKEKK